MIAAGGILRPEGLGAEGPELLIPWRRTRWKLEHAVHALYVYARVGACRRAALADGSLGVTAEAVASAAQATLELVSGLEALADYLKPEGQRILGVAR